MSPSASGVQGLFGGQALFRSEFIVAVSLRHRMAGLSMLYRVNLNSNTQAAAAAHPLEFEVSMCRTSRFARSFLPAQV